MALQVFSASEVDFYATESSSSDASMVKMTTDLFFTQLMSLEGYIVNDCRDKHYQEGVTDSRNIIFFAEIQETEENQWLCTLNAINLRENKNVSSTKKYESSYKILLDAKSTLENLLKNLSSGTANSITDTLPHEIPQAELIPETPAVSPEDDFSLETLAGTWGGENLVEKILILRSGKGFVIFKNGASMNIEVKVSGKNVTVTQTSRSNASFFPELDRQNALKNAANAKPITWELTVSDDFTLSGIKNTLLTDTSSAQGVSYGTVNVEWKKK